MQKRIAKKVGAAGKVRATGRVERRGKTPAGANPRLSRIAAKAGSVKGGEVERELSRLLDAHQTDFLNVMERMPKEGALLSLPGGRRLMMNRHTGDAHYVNEDGGLGRVAMKRGKIEAKTGRRVVFVPPRGGVPG